MSLVITNVIIVNEDDEHESVKRKNFSLAVDWSSLTIADDHSSNLT